MQGATNIKEDNLMNHIRWTEVLGWGPEQIDSLRYVGYCYLKQGVYDVAFSFFNALSILEPENVYDLQTIGALHLQMGNAEKALDALDRALKLDPNHFPTKLNRAKALFMLGYKEQGLIQATEATKAQTQDLVDQALALILSYKS